MFARTRIPALNASDILPIIGSFCSPNRSRLYRTNKDKTEVVNVELGDILNRGNLKTNIPVKPGDVVTVPERFF